MLSPKSRANNSILTVIIIISTPIRYNQAHCVRLHFIIIICFWYNSDLIWFSENATLFVYSEQILTVKTRQGDQASKNVKNILKQ